MKGCSVRSSLLQALNLLSFDIYIYTCICQHVSKLLGRLFRPFSTSAQDHQNPLCDTVWWCMMCSRILDHFGRSPMELLLYVVKDTCNLQHLCNWASADSQLKKPQLPLLRQKRTVLNVWWSCARPPLCSAFLLWTGSQEKASSAKVSHDSRHISFLAFHHPSSSIIHQISSSLIIQVSSVSPSHIISLTVTTD